MGIIFRFRRLIYCGLIAVFNGLMLVLPFSILRINLLRIVGGTVGSGTIIRRGVRFDFPWRIMIGEKCFISAGVYLDCRGGSIIINDFCDISEGVLIYSLSHNINSRDFSIKRGDITVQDRVWLCARAIILPGTIVSSGCVVGANSVLSGSTKSDTLYVGVPAAEIRGLNTNRSTEISRDGLC